MRALSSSFYRIGTECATGLSSASPKTRRDPPDDDREDDRRDGKDDDKQDDDREDHDK